MRLREAQEGKATQSALLACYAEKDPIRGEDSFVTFAEVFQLALDHNADMVLLAGDLFHDNKPSRRALHRCMEIMRDHCLGDRPVDIEVVSDQKSNFHSKCVRCAQRAPAAQSCQRSIGTSTTLLRRHPPLAPPPPPQSTVHALLARRAPPMLCCGALHTASCTRLYTACRRYRTVNFEDPNYNIQLPVFSIHGNHVRAAARIKLLHQS